MKTTTLLSILAACAVGTEAFSLSSFFQQQILSPQVAKVSEEASNEFGLAAYLDSAKELPNEVRSAWEQMQQKLPKNEIEKLVATYQSKYSVKAKNFNNRIKDFSKTFTASTSQQDQFETLSNDKFAEYSLRVNKNKPELLGLDNVKQYTGYLDVDVLDKHFFYWFFESRNDPKNDPVILWLNGGPGCSSATGLFFELGPSSINATLQPEFNPYSWNSNASVIFLDQPVGVGYSYTGGDQVKDTAAAARDVYVFLELFFQKFSKFAKNDFHIAGESYAGHYIPSFASEIINNADRSFELTSVLIGNGITDSLIQNSAYKPMACGEGGYKPVLSEEQCDQMEKDYPKCATLTKICYQFQSALTCVPAQYYCDAKLFSPYAETGLNPYDIRKPCADEGGNCYVEMDYIDDYLNLDSVKAAVGASNIDIFTSCDSTVFNNFILSGDESKPFQQYVAELLEHDIPVLLYAGDKDFICNWLGNHYWSDALDYVEHEQFEAAPLQPWISREGRIAGEVKNYKKFTFVRVYDAGHMVPYDQPENSLDMVNRWIQGDYSFGYKK
ncbi:carboxypeptidase Y precursor [Scheffersomyces xylosifermentans]|uniref:carboxypeptidase Y precursor n=1 Tax=Scheffersomyces xylosifermentans TaxID=1304137 RepID=UPI00315D4A19